MFIFTLCHQARTEDKIIWLETGFNFSSVVAKVKCNEPIRCDCLWMLLGMELLHGVLHFLFFPLGTEMLAESWKSDFSAGISIQSGLRSTQKKVALIGEKNSTD